MDLNNNSSLEWKDNIGQVLREGDIVFTLNGKYTLEKVKRLGAKKHDGIWDEYVQTIVFQDGRTMNACNVWSLTALGYSGEVKKTSNEMGRDALGNSIEVGDVVLCVSRQMIPGKGKVQKLSTKTCKIGDLHNMEPKTWKYSQVISLSALGKEKNEIHHG